MGNGGRSIDWPAAIQSKGSGFEFQIGTFFIPLWFYITISKRSDIDIVHLKWSGYVDIQSYYKFISNSLNQ